jgi:hypothetical protein
MGFGTSTLLMLHTLGNPIQSNLPGGPQPQLQRELPSLLRMKPW